MDKFFQVVDTLVKKPEPKPRRTVKQVLIDFYYLSTAHGISHAATAPSRTIRYFWIAVFLICMVIMCLQLWLIIQKFFSYPYIVQVDIRYEKVAFPAVTLCNLNPFKLSATKDAKETGQTLKMLSAALSQGEKGNQRNKRQAEDNSTEPEIISTTSARYFPVYADCACELNEAGKKGSGSCFSGPNGVMDKDFVYPRNRYRKSICICDYDTKYNSAWPCFPSISWTSEICIHCDKHGHCPMRFWDSNQHVGKVHRCICHEEFNHCVIDLDTEIPNLRDLTGEGSKVTADDGPTTIPTTTTTTTMEPEIIEALGFEEDEGELSVKSKGSENLMYAVAEMSPERKETMSYSQKDLILLCSFNGHDCEERDFKLHLDPSYGNCFTFNHNTTRDPPLRATRAGAMYGLRLMMFVNVSEYLPTTAAVGVRVSVHSPSNVPYPDAFGYSAPVGSETSFGIKLKKFSRLPKPYGQCWDKTYTDTLSDYIYSGDYTVEGCYRSCYQNELVKRCGCGVPRFPVAEGNITCSTTNATARKCLETAESKLGESSLTCYCQQPCKENGYDVTFSTSQWPSPATQVAECITGDELCLDHYRRNGALVQIYYEQLNYETLTEIPVYVLANLLSDFGGQLGLWLGLSVISVLEFLMLIYDLTKTSYLDRKDRKYLAKQSNKSYNNENILECLCDCQNDEKEKEQVQHAAEQLMASAYARKLANTSFGQEMMHLPEEKRAPSELSNWSNASPAQLTSHHGASNGGDLAAFLGGK